MDKESKTYRYPVALTIAGSDSGGGAGIQADIKTFSAIGVFGTSAITAVTAQNTRGVRGIQPIAPDIVKGQIEAVLEDFTVDAIKIGMLHNVSIINEIARILPEAKPIPIILDPVMISTSGSRLLENDAIQAFIDKLLPLATLLTPNIPETEYLSGVKIKDTTDIARAASILRNKGCEAILIKGGHIAGKESTDHLFIKGEETLRLTSPTIKTQNTHGTGCTLSSAIAAYMALGYSLTEAVRQAKTYINEAIIHGADARMGEGHGPVNHFFSPSILHKIDWNHA